MKLFCLGTLVALSSCSLRLNDTVTQPTHAVNSGSGCLSKSGDVFDKFQKGTLTEQEHAELFSCVNKALSTFLDFANGKTKEYFEPSELGGFLSKYFLDGKPIPKSLLDETMALKVALVGGTNEHLSRDDLRHMMTVIDHIRELTGALRPYMPFSANSFLARGLSGTEFEEAMRAFTDASSTFGKSFQGAQGAYTFDHFSGLIRELRGFMYPNGVPEQNWSNGMIRVAAVLPSAKLIFISPPRQQMSPEDWPRFYRLAPRYFVSMLRVNFYLQSPFNTVQSGGLQTVERLFSDFIGNFNYLLDQHPNQQITSEEIDDFVQAIFDQKFTKCDPVTARQFIKVAFGRILGASADPSKFSVTKDSLNRFTENLRFLLEGAHAAEAMYRPKFGDNFVAGSLSAAEIAAIPDSVLLDSTTLKNDFSAAAVNQLKNTPITMHTVFPGTDSMVVIPDHGMPDQFSFMHMLRVHALRSANRLLIQAYGDPAKNSLSADQVETFVADVIPMLSEFGVADSSIQASVPKRLIEASLFLYSSDGQQGLSMNEALEMESLLLSTLENAPRIHEALADACGVPPKFDDTPMHKRISPEIPAACYREQFVKQYEKIWGYLPGLVKFGQAHTPEEHLGLFDKLAAFLHPASAGDIYRIADTQSFLQMPYYAELIFSRFDTNGDGMLDNAEAAAAFPVFRPFIAQKAAAKGLTDVKDHEAIFYFLLAYRVLPTDDKWDFALRRYLLGPKTFTVDRGQVVEIFQKLLSL